jgi:hypothetical protein
MLTPRRRTYSENLIFAPIFKTFPAFYGTRPFIPVSTEARYKSLVSAKQNQSARLHTILRNILILSPHLFLGFPTKPLSVLPIFPIPAMFPVHLVLLDLITIIIFCEKYKI